MLRALLRGGRAYPRGVGEERRRFLRLLGSDCNYTDEGNKPCKLRKMTTRAEKARCNRTWGCIEQKEVD